MYKQISEDEFNKLLNSYEQGGTYQKRNQLLLTMIGLLNTKARLYMRLMSLNTQSGRNNINL